MAAYEYQALDAKGRRKHGVLEADPARLVRQQLREQGLTPLEVTETVEKARREASGFSLFRPSMSTGDLALITRQLATLVAAALPIEESLKAVAEQCEKPKQRTLISAVRGKAMPWPRRWQPFRRCLTHSIAPWWRLGKNPVTWKRCSTGWRITPNNASR